MAGKRFEQNRRKKNGKKMELLERKRNPFTFSISNSNGMARGSLLVVIGAVHGPNRNGAKNEWREKTFGKKGAKKMA